MEEKEKGNSGGQDRKERGWGCIYTRRALFNFLPHLCTSTFIPNAS